MGRFHPAPHRLDRDTLYEDPCEGLAYKTKLPESWRTLSPLIISRLYMICNPRPRVCYRSLGASSSIVYTHTMHGIHVYFVHTPITNIQYQEQAFSSTTRVPTWVKLCLVLPSSLTVRDILPNDLMESYLPTTKREVCLGGGNVCERCLKIMCVRETRRHIYVRIEGQQRPCVCVYACERNSVFQLRLVKNALKLCYRPPQTSTRLDVNLRFHKPTHFSDRYSQQVGPV